MPETATNGDLRKALDLVHDVWSEPGPDPFPLPVLERLASLVGSHTIGYCEHPIDPSQYTCDNSYALRNRTAPEWLGSALDQWGSQDPTGVCSNPRNASTGQSLAISDFLSRRAFERLEVYQYICRPSSVEDSLRVYLPPTQTSARFFFFDRDSRGFGGRERDLLQILRPHLALWRNRWDTARDPRLRTLTKRELEILRAAAEGATNREIAGRLWISPHTVRKHLENIFEKLGVHTRTEAVTLLHTGGPGIVRFG